MLPLITFYKLDGRTVVACSYEEASAQLADITARRVGYDIIGPVAVSTIFMTQPRFGDGYPLLDFFETMVRPAQLGDPAADELAARINQTIGTCHYHTYDEAEAGHLAIVRHLMEMVRRQPDLLELLPARRCG